MNLDKNNRGFAPFVIIALIGILLVGGGMYLIQKSSDDDDDSMVLSEKIEPTSSEVVIVKDKIISTEQGDGAVKEGVNKIMLGEPSGSDETEENNAADQDIKFSGNKLAGNASVLLDFNQADYELAINSKKIVVLYFYANWCPTCKVKFPKMISAFNKLDSNDVVGFRINFNDSETDDNENALAKEFGVVYQDTKVLLKDGERVLKSPEGWDEKRYLDEIDKLIN